MVLHSRACQVFGDPKLTTPSMDPRANRTPHHLRVAVVLRGVSFRDARALVRLLEQALFHERFCQIACPAREVAEVLGSLELLAELTQDLLGSRRISGQELDLAEHRRAIRLHRSTQAEIFEGRSSRIRERAGPVEIVPLRYEPAEERVQVRGARKIERFVVEEHFATADGFFDRGGAPVKRRRDLTDTGRGWPPGSLVMSKRALGGFLPRLVVTPVAPVDEAGEEPRAAEFPPVVGPLEDRNPNGGRLEEIVPSSLWFTPKLDVLELDSCPPLDARI